GLGVGIVVDADARAPDVDPGSGRVHVARLAHIPAAGRVGEGAHGVEGLLLRLVAGVEVAREGQLAGPVVGRDPAVLPPARAQVQARAAGDAGPGGLLGDQVDDPGRAFRIEGRR